MTHVGVSSAPETVGAWLWSARLTGQYDRVAHATGSAAKIVALVEGGELWGRSKPADWVCVGPAAWLRELAERLGQALPGADLDAPRVSPQGEVLLRRAQTAPFRTWLCTAGTCTDHQAGEPNYLRTCWCSAANWWSRCRGCSRTLDRLYGL